MSRTLKRPPRAFWCRAMLWTVAALAVAFGAVQLVPYGRDHSNPPPTNDFRWNDAGAETIARESCYDCHSNETEWWWATSIAPFSWLVQRDADEGREHLNFSEWTGDLTPEAMQDAVDEEMPPWQYLVIHWGARLSEEEKRTLVDGFASSLQAN